MNQCNCQRYGIQGWSVGTILAGMILFGGITGCGSKKEKEAKAPASQQVKAVKSTALDTGGDASASVPPPVSTSVASTAPIAGAAELAATGEVGDPANTATVLRILNAAYRQYSDPYARPDAESQAPKKIYPPAKDLTDLVKAGFLKSVPPAPAGMKYVIDTANGQVVLQ